MSETIMNISNPYEGERRAGNRRFPAARRFRAAAESRTAASERWRNRRIYLRGPNVFAGYWKREDATREAFVDG